LNLSFWWKWVPTTLDGSQWLLEPSLGKPSCQVWQKIQEPLTQDH